MTEGMGVEGVTNGFVSALWALDLTVEFAKMGGRRMQFMVDFDQRVKQSVFYYPSSSVQANPIYYAMLMMGIISK